MYLLSFYEEPEDTRSVWEIQSRNVGIYSDLVKGEAAVAWYIQQARLYPELHNGTVPAQYDPSMWADSIIYNYQQRYQVNATQWFVLEKLPGDADPPPPWT